ncbi:MAG: hypothetical protein LBC75_00810 [Fibromonadaceae bacterium]|jgi:hypothetical protein|nr:hypothetical protein [Fibromonadaceae bacterium]
MKNCINKDQHDNSAGKANETALSSSSGSGGGVIQEGRKEDRLPPKIFWEKRKREFLPLWAFYPKKGRRDYENCLRYYNKIKASMPSMAYLCGVVAHLDEKVWGEYPPSLMRFMENKDWIGINDSAKSCIERNIADWGREVQRKVDIFNGMQPNNIPPKQQELPPIPDFVPSADEVARMPSLESDKLKLKCGYGHIYTPDFVNAVHRRDQLRKENSQTQEENTIPDW